MLWNILSNLSIVILEVCMYFKKVFCYTFYSNHLLCNVSDSAAAFTAVTTATLPQLLKLLQSVVVYGVGGVAERISHCFVCCACREFSLMAWEDKWVNDEYLLEFIKLFSVIL